jgi:hypothetical protein
LKINYHKSEIFCFGKAKDEEDNYRNIFGYEVGSLPFKYLGIPIHYRRLLNKEWKPIEDRFERRLTSWLGKLLSYGDWLVLINSVLSNLPMFLLSFFEIPKGVRKRVNFYRSRFFWQSDGQKKKYRLTKWNIVCRPKDQGILELTYLILRRNVYLANGFLNFFRRKAIGKNYCPTSTLGVNLFHKFRLNLPILLFGPSQSRLSFTFMLSHHLLPLCTV